MHAYKFDVLNVEHNKYLAQISNEKENEENKKCSFIIL